jgi:dolichyl-phosphate-mannose--protein O-mannosyl transferase
LLGIFVLLENSNIVIGAFILLNIITVTLQASIAHCSCR